MLPLTFSILFHQLSECLSLFLSILSLFLLCIKKLYGRHVTYVYYRKHTHTRSFVTFPAFVWNYGASAVKSDFRKRCHSFAAAIVESTNLSWWFSRQPLMSIHSSRFLKECTRIAFGQSLPVSFAPPITAPEEVSWSFQDFQDGPVHFFWCVIWCEHAFRVFHRRSFKISKQKNYQRDKSCYVTQSIGLVLWK